MRIIDTSQRDATRPWPGRIILFALGAAGFVAIGLLMMTGAISIDRNKAFDQVVGAAFFSLRLVAIAWAMHHRGGPLPGTADRRKALIVACAEAAQGH